MHDRTRVAVAVLAAMLLLALGAGSASALRSVRVRGGEAGVQLSGRYRFNGGENFVECNVTLLRTVSRLIPKRTGVLFGRIYGVAIDRGTLGSHCTKSPTVEGADIIPLAGPGRPGRHREFGEGFLLYEVGEAAPELWKLIYDSFQGTLPGITGIFYHVQQAQFNIVLLISSLRVECGYNGNISGRIEVEEGLIRRAGVSREGSILRRERGGILCPPELSVDTPSGVTVTPTLTIELL